MRQRYRRKADQFVTAICLALDFDGLDFRKWGDSQHAKPGDWLVDNNGEVYTVDAQTFSRTYQQVSPGRWIKVSPVWAEQKTDAGSVITQEGCTHYEAGAWLVSNDPEGTDSYAISNDRFHELYELYSSENITD